MYKTKSSRPVLAMLLPRRASLAGTFLMGVLVTGLFAGAERAHAQGIDRESMTGAAAAAGAHGSDVNQPYNVQAGPVNLRVSADLSTTYNDNINIANTGRQHDIIVTPSVAIGGVWQATPLNALTFDVGIGYQIYTMHSGNDALTISPNSKTQFQIFVDDFKITLHDQFSYQQDPLQVGQLSNISQFSRFQNTAGFTVDWDLNDIVLTVGYDHQNLWVFQSAYNYLTSQTDTVSGRATFAVSKTISTGVSASYSAMRYDQNIQNNNGTIMVGPFASAQISENLAVNGSMGWISGNYDQGGLNGDTSNLGSFYGSVGVNHRINDVLREALTGGQEYLPGVTSNYTQRVYANYMISWKATDFLNVSPNLWWEALNDSNAINQQTSNRYGAGLNLSYKLTDQASLTGAYQYTAKDCNQTNFSYVQNQVTLGFHYQF